MASVRFTGVGKRYADVEALAPLDLTIADGEAVSVLGPSGCGKSTLLRLTAGLETVSSGTIHLDERRIDTLPAPERDVAMVFQSYALYPHLRVGDNIAFPLRMRRIPAVQRRAQVGDVADLLGIGELLDRYPAQLSGGQRQRVALARALVRRPALFLLDEPLSNVDARLRDQLRRYIRDLQKRLRVTMLYVTHDHAEAMALGDRVALFERGQLLQVDTPLELFERPATRFVAEFLGTPAMNLLPATWAAGRLMLGDVSVPVPGSLAGTLGSAARQLVLGIRPEAFTAAHGDHHLLLADVDAASAERLGSDTLLTARLGGALLTVRLPGSPRRLPLRVAAPPEAIHVFDAVSGRRIGP